MKLYQQPGRLLNLSECSESFLALLKAVRVVKCWMIGVFVMSVLVLGQAMAAIPVSWKATGFGINANAMTLASVLHEFSITYGVKVNNSLRQNPHLHGRIQAGSGAEFLDRLAAKHAFRWFVYNDALFIVPANDSTSMRIQVGEDAVMDSKAALIGLGLFDARFGWGEIPDEGAVMVSGPRPYVELVRDTLAPQSEKKDSGGGTKQIMVFRLKYASATDRTIATRGQADNVIPGVKTILAGLLNTPAQNAFAPDEFATSSRKRSRTGKLGSGSASELVTSPRSGDSSRTLLADARDLNRNGRAVNEDNDPDTNNRRNRQKDQAVRIDADPSLNAIIIYDSGSKRAMYQALIAELDIEPQQIEIEALIVDIDRNKLSQLGAEWGFALGAINASINGTNSDARGAETPASGSTLVIRNSAGFYARLTALEQKGDAHVLAKPTISTLENIAAVLDLSQSAYVPLVGERVADLANVNVGTMLKVTPRIVREGNLIRVRLDINIEDGNFTGQSASSTNVARSTITTQAIVELQHTLLIGGYHSEAKAHSKQKIPVLGDIPIFGALFQNNSDGVHSRERLFLITPRIVGQTGLQANAESAVAEQARRLLPRKDRSLPPMRQRKGDDVRAPLAIPVLEAAQPASEPILPSRQSDGEDASGAAPRFAPTLPPSITSPAAPPTTPTPTFTPTLTPTLAAPVPRGPSPERVLAALTKTSHGIPPDVAYAGATAVHDAVGEPAIKHRNTIARQVKRTRRQSVLLLRFRS